MVTVRNSTRQYETVRDSTHTSTEQYTTVHTSTQQYTPVSAVHNSTQQYTAVQRSTKQYHQYTTVCSSIASISSISSILNPGSREYLPDVRPDAAVCTAHAGVLRDTVLRCSALLLQLCHTDGGLPRVLAHGGGGVVV